MALSDKILYAFFVLLSQLFLAKSSGFDEEAKVDQVLREALQCHPHNPGLSVSIVNNGKVLMSKGYGVIDVASQRPVTNNTIFGLASLSKAFTSTLLMKQIHHKNLSIYTHLTDILGPDFQFSTLIRTQNANLRDLLSHTLGIPRHNYMRFDPTLNLTSLPSRIKYLKPVHPFRSSYMYNNLLYGLVSAISQKFGGKAWEDLIQENIYNPLGMSSSTFMTRVNEKAAEVAQGYTDDFETDTVVPVSFDLDRQWGKICGSTDIVSTANDISKWLMFHLNGGKNAHGHQVIDKEALASIYFPRNPIRSSTVGHYFTKPQVPVTTSENTYAFGWKNGYYRGYPILRHTGTTWGYSSLITLIPVRNIGIFTAMTGSDHNYIFRTLLHNYLADVTLGESPWLNSTTICSFPEPWYHASPTSQHSIVKTLPLHRSVSQYVGTYHNAAYGDLYIHTVSAAHLTMKYGTGSWKLYPKHTRDQFSGVGEGLANNIDLTTVTFHAGSHSSSVHSLEIPSFESNDPPIFQKTSTTVHFPGAGVIG